MPSTSKPHSFEVTEGKTRAPARAMLRAVGMGDGDWDKPQIGVASSWNEITPCNLSLDRLAKRAKEGVHAAGGDRKSTRLNSSHANISYAVFCLKKKKKKKKTTNKMKNKVNDDKSSKKE